MVDNEALFMILQDNILWDKNIDRLVFWSFNPKGRRVFWANTIQIGKTQVIFERNGQKK